MAVKRTPETMYKLVEHHTRQVQRDLHRAVYPWEVQARLPIARSEASLKRDMNHLYQSGRLVRVGGEGARQGYRLPTLMERVSWSINQGVWPHGSERIAWAI